MSKLSLKNVSKNFSNSSGETICILNGIDLEVADGAFFSLLGASGCGKSTLLNIVAGFEEVSGGEIKIGANAIEGPGTDRTVIFQDVSNALFPYMTVFENVEFGPKMSGQSKTDRKNLVDKYLNLVSLEKDADKFPFELSGGMKQRVQIARALANDPDILLIDGGKGQVSRIDQVLDELQITDVYLLGISKGTTRKSGWEYLWRPQTAKPILPDAHDAGFRLLQYVRDEAHRFAITGHRKERAKKRGQSDLEKLPGVGPKRRRELLLHFGSLRNMRGAPRAEFEKVPGISKALAGQIFAVLHGEEQE